MLAEPRICVLIPVFNHGRTVGPVIQGAQALFPVIVVNDGSTDETAEVLARQSGATVLTLPRNQGKGEALRAGFAAAGRLGFTHAITLDADGQHPPQALESFAAACRQEPEALIVGVRNLRLAGAPWARRLTNRLSNFCFRLETGQPIPDTQCGYRCYPLAMLNSLHVGSGRYAFELEALVKAAWAGVRLVSCPVAVDYAAETSRLSHFHPWRDLAHVAWLHAQLCARAFRAQGPVKTRLALT
jgi:glycosyltransferase involved in cell wall biosynthesis